MMISFLRMGNWSTEGLVTWPGSAGCGESQDWNAGSLTPDIHSWALNTPSGPFLVTTEGRAWVPFSRPPWSVSECPTLCMRLLFESLLYGLRIRSYQNQEPGPTRGQTMGLSHRVQRRESLWDERSQGQEATESCRWGTLWAWPLRGSSWKIFEQIPATWARS